ncbi:hypothetical protein [Microcystis sp. M_QC_C_20170808_M9Col]|uniref:hypothetical protein n=1 Tax=Microcystis sp. M_QC_C_20170808_M9Col TaxID=2486217 RepID=UPI00118FB2FD|nr:hypothetical protein [Microcystis sp. M_QC_C_20170808_M9Col]TRT68940.1 MAG: hypothetical protein EWV68_09995 [Microcystis sp. M_QC_C_20170808_M9Col]
MPIVFNLERANQLSLLPDKDLADFCPLIEPYQVTKNLTLSLNYNKERQTPSLTSPIHHQSKFTAWITEK